MIVTPLAPAALAACLCLPLVAVAQGLPAPGRSSVEPLTLTAAVALARRHAPAVGAAQARALAAVAAATAARQWRGPTLDLSVENLGPQDLDHDAFVWFTQPLDIGARRSTRMAAAQASRELLGRTVDAQRRVVDLAVVQTYLEVVRERQVTALLAGHQHALSEMVSLVRRRVDEGMAAEGDLRKLEAEQARTMTARIRSDLAQRQSGLALGVLIGEADPEIAARLMPPLAPPVAAADVAAAIERRPDIRAAAALVEQQRAAAAVERALGSTAIAAMGGYKRTSGFNTATAGVSIDLPIGLRNTPARLRAEAEVVAATLELEQARAMARLDIDQALLAAQVLTAQAARLDEDLVQPALVAQRAARAAFREGTGDALALVDADRVHLDSQREAVTMQLDAVAASIRARLALGEDPLP